MLVSTRKQKNFHFLVNIVCIMENFPLYVLKFNAQVYYDYR
jgi:hypothetical protein